MRLFICALVALNVALIHAARLNNADVEQKSAAEADVVKRKGDARDLFAGFQNDDATVVACARGDSCNLMSVADAKALEANALQSVEAVKGETDVVNALTPTLATMAESIRSLQAQKAMLNQLAESLAAMNRNTLKGQEIAEAANNQYANSLTKGLVFSEAASKAAAAAAPMAKGIALAPLPPSKGISMAAMPPSKGANYGYASEAMLCPMTMFELRNCQKLSAEMKIQKDAANAMNAQLLAEKQRLENALAASEMLRKKAEEQAAYNAKVAAENKAQAEMLGARLGVCEAEKAVLIRQKENLEEDLTKTQAELTVEKQQNAQLTADLSECNENNAALTTALAEMTERAESAEEELAATKARLEEEIERAITLEENLNYTTQRLGRCEKDLVNERTAREETEEELMDTMRQLASCQSANALLEENLRNTQAELQNTATELARETAARKMLQEKLDETTEQLRQTEQALRETQRALEDEKNAHNTTRRILADTQAQLEATEAARAALEEANNQCQSDLAFTKEMLARMTDERDQLKEALDKTLVALEECKAGKAKCDSDLATQTSIAEQLNKQLTEAVALLKAEKEAREQLVATMLLVQQTSQKLQEDLKQLQVENAQLQAQVQKLQAEQSVALAMAAGCPPTYEKFGTSCYKYVREKTQWKMAQEQCMKESGNLVAIESTQEQVFVTNYLKRLGATDAYAYTSGNKQYNGWKWLGAKNNHMGASGVEFWYNMETKQKPMYDCQAMYLYDPNNYGKWVGLQCRAAAPYVCEYQLVPYTATPYNAAEQMAVLKMAAEAPYYLKSIVRK